MVYVLGLPGSAIPLINAAWVPRLAWSFLSLQSNCPGCDRALGNTQARWHTGQAHACVRKHTAHTDTQEGLRVQMQAGYAHADMQYIP